MMPCARGRGGSVLATLRRKWELCAHLEISSVFQFSLDAPRVEFVSHFRFPASSAKLECAKLQVAHGAASATEAFAFNEKRSAKHVLRVVSASHIDALA